METGKRNYRSIMIVMAEEPQLLWSKVIVSLLDTHKMFKTHAGLAQPSDYCAVWNDDVELASSYKPKESVTMPEHLNTDTERKREIQRVKEVAEGR